MRPATFRRSPDTTSQTGFTLVEIIVGIVVSAIALTFLTTLFFSNAGRSVEPLLQIRAAEFGQALMDEILSKKFDELTPVGGVPACTACSSSLGAEAGEDRTTFDDVDDYDVYCAGDDLINSQGTNLSATDLFKNYSMRVCVDYDGDYNGTPDTNVSAKLITVDIIPPTGAGLGGSAITISAYRSNF